MSIINTRAQTINTKVVYYGPGLGGKTSSLQAVHRILDPDRRLRLISLKTEEDRTLFFDHVPLELGPLDGYRVRVQAFTVPGQVKYNLTRRYVLMGVDAVIFVADSQAARRGENLESLQNLKENLAANGIAYEEIPLVLQLNKRDLPDILPVEELAGDLNDREAPVFPSSATRGEGVFEPFVEATRMLLRRIVARYGIDPEPEAVEGAAVRYLERLRSRSSS